MTIQNTQATRTHLQPLQRAFHALVDFCFEHGGTLKNHKQFHELASELYKEICNLNARAVAAPEPAAQPYQKEMSEMADDLRGKTLIQRPRPTGKKLIAAEPAAQQELYEAAADTFILLGVIHAGTEQKHVLEVRERLGKALRAHRARQAEPAPTPKPDRN
jgi:hypothetical protein